MTVNNGLSGFAFAFEGVKLILKPELRRFVLIPFLINLLVFSGLIWLGVSQFEGFMDRMLPQDSWLTVIRWLLWPLFALAAILVVFYTFTLVANLIASPFNALLAEKVEWHLTGNPPPRQDAFWKTLPTVILSELHKLTYFLLRVIPLLILFLIPGLNLLAPVLWFLFGAWFLTLQYVDFPMGNHGIGFGAQREHFKGKRLAALSFGSGITLLMMIPLLNFIAMPAAVAGATAMWCRSRAQPTGQ
jgi:CysZ protein